MKKKKSKKLRPMGEITDDMEKLLVEMYCEHGLQFHEVLGLIHAYTAAHTRFAFEVYEEDGTHPVLYYGPKEYK